MTGDPEKTELAARRLRARNWALLGLLAGFVVAIYLITLVKMH